VLETSKILKRLLCTRRKFAENESGATAIEYGIIAAVIALALFTAGPTLSEKVSTKFANVSTSLTTADEKDTIISNSKPVPQMR